MRNYFDVRILFALEKTYYGELKAYYARYIINLFPLSFVTTRSMREILFRQNR